MKATDLVLTQHREIEQLFERLETAGESDKKVIREELAQDLIAHAVIEEEHLYPAMKPSMREEIERAYVEHGMAAYALSQVLSSRPGDETFRAKVAVLKALVMQHVREEESEILKKADSALGSERLMRLGEEMELRFEQVKAKGYKTFLRQELAKAAPQARGGRAMAKKTAAAKAPAAAKRAATRRALERGARGERASTSPPEQARRAAKHSATTGARKNGHQKARSARATSR